MQKERQTNRQTEINLVNFRKRELFQTDNYKWKRAGQDRYTDRQTVSFLMFGKERII